MAKKTLDVESHDEKEGDLLYNQYLKDMITGNIDFELIEGSQIKAPQTDDRKSKDSNNPVNVAVKVDRDTISKNHHGIVDDTDTAESLVRDLESRLGKRLGKKKRTIMLYAASINIKLGKGITVKHLVNRDIHQDTAEKNLGDLRDAGFLMVMDKRSGHRNQYALSNYIQEMTSDVSIKNQEEERIQFDVISVIASELSSIEQGYHNIGLGTYLNYEEDYDDFDWSIPSKENKQKIKEFRLDKTRSCVITISPSKFVGIDIQCTHDPYFFHSSKSLVDIFADAGDIRSILKSAAYNRTNVVPRVGEWYIEHFDYNKDISTKSLEDKYPSKVISWRGRGLIKLDHLGTLFQIYNKKLPCIGDSLRIDGHYRPGEHEKMKSYDMIAHLSDPSNTHPFTALEDMLSQMAMTRVKDEKHVP